MPATRQKPWGDSPPDGAEHFVVIHHKKPILVRPASGDSNTPSAVVAYEGGEEVPADVAEKVWPAFGDRLAALDAAGNRLDRPSSAEKAVTGAPRMNSDAMLEKWRRDTGLTSPSAGGEDANAGVEDDAEDR